MGLWYKDHVVNVGTLRKQDPENSTQKEEEE